MNNDHKKTILPILLLNARPGAGKSEIIRFLSELSEKERKDVFHIGKMKIIDDFPYLWRWFEEDHLLSEMKYPRLFTDDEGYFKYIYLWDLLIRMMNLEYEKFLRDEEDPENFTVIIEFSRGKQHGGYERAFPLLSDEIIKNLSILYVNVSWEESLRKNRRRYNPDKPDSILEHGIPDKKLEFMYSEDDFHELITGKNQIEINGKMVPFSIFENEDDVTTDYQPELRDRLLKCMNSIWEKQN